LEKIKLDIKMFGVISVNCGDKTLVDESTRLNKIWLLFAYMVFYRDRTVTQSELIKLLWGEGFDDDIHRDSLKTMFYRLRKLLDSFGNDIGSRIIVRLNNTAKLCDCVECTVDCEQFEKFYNSSKTVSDPAERLRLYKAASDAYGTDGEFLQKYGNEFWVIFLSSYYHNMYVQLIKSETELLKKDENYKEIIDLCLKAIKAEPYDESIYCEYMNALIETDKAKEATKVYENISKLLFKEFGIIPSDKLRQLYSRASSAGKTGKLSINEIINQMQTHSLNSGARFCEFDFFKTLYQLQRRSGECMNICLLNISLKPGFEPNRRTLTSLLNNLDKLLQSSLREIDVFSRCGTLRYLIMLNDSNYEHSKMAVERIINKYKSQFPASPIELHYSISK